jgi:hypothetical protein
MRVHGLLTVALSLLALPSTSIERALETGKVVVSGPGDYRLQLEVQELAGSEKQTEGLALQSALFKWVKDTKSGNLELLRRSGVKKIIILKQCLAKVFKDDGVLITAMHEGGYWSKSFLDPVLQGQIQTDLETQKPVVSFSDSGTLTVCNPELQRIYRSEIYRLVKGFHSTDAFLSTWAKASDPASTRKVLQVWIDEGKASLESVENEAVEKFVAKNRTDFSELRKFLEARLLESAAPESTTRHD